MKRKKKEKKREGIPKITEFVIIKNKELSITPLYMERKLEN